MSDAAQKRRGAELLWRGIVITMLCGGCTAVVQGASLWGSIRAAVTGENVGDPFYLWVFILLGVVPPAWGLSLIVKGFVVLRRNR